MGTEITLEVGGLTVAWSKNSRGIDHGMLFQGKDRKRIFYGELDYDHHSIEEDDDQGAMAFSRPLRELVPRLELLGFTLENVEREYASCAENWREECENMADVWEEPVPEIMTFPEFCAFATAHPLQALDNSFPSSFEVRGEEDIRGRFVDTATTRRLPYFSQSEALTYSELSYFGSLVGFLHPYSILRLLGQNTSNLDSEVIWHYGPLVDAGWASESEFMEGARRRQTFLIATEGSSDAHILKHALSLLRPEIEDFFRFIDVRNGHPFPGTGNLLKFAEGLVKIDVHNQVVFVFDNDAEGYDAYQRLLCLNLPSNMRAMILPTLEDFRCFPARGPEGTTTADINGRAAAIECYLDLELDGLPPANVVWTNYKKDLDRYHGALAHKESYTKVFLKQTVETVSAGAYNVKKLMVLLDALVAECCQATIDSSSK